MVVQVPTTSHEVNSMREALEQKARDIWRKQLKLWIIRSHLHARGVDRCANRHERAYTWPEVRDNTLPDWSSELQMYGKF